MVNTHQFFQILEEIRNIEWFRKESKCHRHPSYRLFDVTMPVRGPSNLNCWGHLSSRILEFVVNESS